jgi:hypothetical protein
MDGVGGGATDARHLCGAYARRGPYLCPSARTTTYCGCLLHLPPDSLSDSLFSDAQVLVMGATSVRHPLLTRQFGVMPYLSLSTSACRRPGTKISLG